MNAITIFGKVSKSPRKIKIGEKTVFEVVVSDRRQQYYVFVPAIKMCSDIPAVGARVYVHGRAVVNNYMQAGRFIGSLCVDADAFVNEETELF